MAWREDGGLAAQDGDVLKAAPGEVEKSKLTRRMNSMIFDQEELADTKSNCTGSENLVPSYLDNILDQEFAGALHGDQCEPSEVEAQPDIRARLGGRRGSQCSDTVAEELVSSAGKGRGLLHWVMQQRWFTGFFTSLTLYALFVPDLDMYFGNKDSKLGLSIMTSFVVLLFLAEIVLNCFGKPLYICRPYFWLDVIALISLLPDTYVVVYTSANNALVAGRSSRFAKMVQLLTRSSKAARLTRLSRIARVAALMPRLQSFLIRNVKDGDTERLVEKKIDRIFHVIDEDVDGFVGRAAAEKCLAKMRRLLGPQSRTGNWASKVMSGHRNSLLGTGDHRVLPQGGDLRALAAQPASHLTPCSQTSASPAMRSRRPSLAFRSGGDLGYLVRDGAQDQAPPVQVDIEEFRMLCHEDPDAIAGLRRACKAQFQQANNMQNVTSRSSEFIGVKVALSVLVLLFLLILVTSESADKSAEWGLRAVDRLVRGSFPGEAPGGEVPGAVRHQVELWERGHQDWQPEDRRVLYLDLNRRIYCNEFAPASPCRFPNTSALLWADRASLADIESDVRASSFRLVDLVFINVPDLSDEDLSPEERQRLTSSVAVLDGRGAVEAEARMAMLTTVAAIVIILSGIGLLTRDLTYLSRNLLKPLVELADEMESITRLQLAGVSSSEDPGLAHGTCEVRLIRETFENMKKAIKSWGKYVPWPVVQLLLRKDAEEPNMELQEREVTILFSDIASFTTIVESLPPERSLLLLSRYFHDMSKIIDAYGGIVLEFIGDAIMCIYGAPVRNQEHPTDAVKSAVRMLDSLTRMNHWFARKSLPEVSIRCGVHTGRVLVGNMGIHSRMKYGIVGEEAEIPARLEEMNKSFSTRLLISEATFLQLVPEVFIVRLIDYVHLRPGKDGEPPESQPVYEVMERNRASANSAKAKAKHAAAELHTAGMHLYRERDFEGAAERLREAGEVLQEALGEEDAASALLRRRCKAYIEDPPPDDWDGVWDRGH